MSVDPANMFDQPILKKIMKFPDDNPAVAILTYHHLEIFIGIDELLVGKFIFIRYWAGVFEHAGFFFAKMGFYILLQEY